MMPRTKYGTKFPSGLKGERASGQVENYMIAAYRIERAIGSLNSYFRRRLMSKTVHDENFHLGFLFFDCLPRL